MKFLFDFYTQTDLLILVSLTMVFSLFIILSWKKVSSRIGGIEYQSIQRIHKDKEDIPRMGGLILFVGLMLCLFINVDIDPWLNKELKPIFSLLLLCNIPLFFVALKEDVKYNVQPFFRLFAIILSSLIFITYQPYGLPIIDIPYLGNFLNIPIVSIIFFTIAHAGYCNGMNLIDGSNGLAGMVVFTTLLSIGFVSFMLADLVILYVALILIAFITIFLLFNYPWGSIFLGDSGAYLWGSLLASLTIILYARHDVPTWGAVVILFYPSTEMVFSFIRKKYQKKNPLLPDPDHMHLKLYFVIERSVKRARVANCLVMPMISLVWLTPALIIPWVFNDSILSIISVILLTVLYFGFYWALPSKNKIKK
jgi:UDP-GlcNAc:undecaprenyl-phosphate GlcNAc-1-phosphate transferase